MDFELTSEQKMLKKAIREFAENEIAPLIVEADEEEKSRVEELGIKVVVTNTVMKSLEDKVELAKTVLAEAKR